MKNYSFLSHENFFFLRKNVFGHMCVIFRDSSSFPDNVMSFILTYHSGLKLNTDIPLDIYIKYQVRGDNFHTQSM